MGQGLSAKKCDLKIIMNNNNHHTEEISTERLIVRRGQPFVITVNFSSPVHNYLKQLKRIFLSVQTGPQRSKADGTQVKFPISSLGDQKQWSARLEEQDPYFWTISVNTPANAPIGQYDLFLHASKACRLLGKFILLFNPWCRDDEVFLPNEAQRQEYILNQDGVIYSGTENEILAQPWDFRQFDVGIVDICFKLLDIGERYQRDQDHTQRKNPIYICRTVAAMMNCNLARILSESGTRECYDGTPPSKWLGSNAILQQWAALQCRPVRYGQCWVFAAVMCSVLRCLGIPTRVVTGFTWAHNTNSNPNVNEYYEEDGTLLTPDKSARVWTFHVWNECWMARTDLLPEYSGWQALDATCQKKSKGPSFCGPAPVQAIKEGDVEVDYDVCYFFAAMNAKCKVWIHMADDIFKPASICTKYMGNNISTKSVGSERCEDITHNYKYPEGSLQEKKVLDKVYRKTQTLQAISSRREITSIPTTLEEKVKLFIDFQSKSSLILGQDIPLSIEVFNYSDREKATDLVLGVQSLHYNGVPIMQLWKEKLNFIIKSNEVRTLQVFVPYSQYGKELGKNRLLRLTATLRDEDSYIYFAQEEISICDPPLTIEFPDNVLLYQPATVKISLLNPLTEPLEKCVIVVGGQGLIYRQRKYRLGTVQPKSTQDLNISFTPTESGPRRLTAHLTCLQIQNLKSYKTINVAAA